jgi:glycyl-tRNA synthetase
MLEIDCTSVTPEPVLVTSGHVAKFSDLMVKDVKTGACYRADHLLEQHLEKLLEQKDLPKDKAEEMKLVIAQADALSVADMHAVMQKYNVKAPDTNNDISAPEPFNLMFGTQIGPSGKIKGYLRPETAQGMFVNFQRLLEYNGGKLPFAASQIGQAFRNEIAPRSGLLRVREFTLAEIEHFVNPEDKRHPKFARISNLVLNLFPREEQLAAKPTIQMTIGEAVKKGVVANETLGYFIARTYLFLTSAGIKKERLRLDST